MNECEHLDEFLAGELTEAQHAAFQDHLPSCPACRQQILLDRQLDGALQSAWQQVTAPDSVSHQWEASRVQPVSEPLKSPRHSVRRHWWPVVTAVSMVGLLAIATWQVMEHSSDEFRQVSSAETPSSSTDVDQAELAIAGDPTQPTVSKPERVEEHPNRQAVTVLFQRDSKSILVPDPAEYEEFTILTAYQVQ